MSRSERQDKIIELLNVMVVENQKQLTDLLKAEGFEVTQATVSRDIKELGLIKKKSQLGGISHYIKPVDPRFRKLKTLFHQSVIKIDYTGNLIIIKTLSGAANSACALVDRLGETDIVGTIAGDDTVMIAVREASSVQNVIKILESFRE
jgi:transcriptional regulator of arginine metabolism